MVGLILGISVFVVALLIIGGATILTDESLT